MTRILHIARREWLELSRQRAMLGVISSLFVVISMLVLATLVLLNIAVSNPEASERLAIWLAASGMELDLEQSLVGTVLSVTNFLFFTQYLGIAAVLAGHTVLHDRQCHTLPFLLLAPVRRFELLAGKVLGAIGIPTALYFLVNGVAAALMSGLAITEPVSFMLPPSPGWLVAFFVGGPAWAMCVSTLCAIVSALVRDVRAAQQVVWFIMFFATFGCGLMLVGSMESGLVAEGIVAGMGVLASVSALWVGAQVISRDLGR